MLSRLVRRPKIYWRYILRACVSLSAVVSCPFKVYCWNRSASAVQQRKASQFLTHVSNIFLHKPSKLLGFHLIRMICGIIDVSFPLLLPGRECNGFSNSLSVNLFILCTYMSKHFFGPSNFCSGGLSPCTLPYKVLYNLRVAETCPCHSTFDVKS